MYIEAISDQNDEMDIFETVEKVHWNGREMEKLQKIDPRTILQPFSNLEPKITLSGKKIAPMMSKVHEGEVKIDGEVDSEGKFTLKAEVSFKFGGGGNNNNDKTENTKADSPPDSTDRDFDKDKN